MTSKSILRLAIQLLGLYFIAQAVLELPRILSVLFLGESSIGVYGDELMIWLGITILTPLVVGFALLFNARRISAFLSRKDYEDDAGELQVEKQAIVEAGSIILGLLLLTYAIPNLYTDIVSSQTYGQHEDLISTIIAIAINVTLIWRARAISKFILKINAIPGEK